MGNFYIKRGFIKNGTIQITRDPNANKDTEINSVSLVYELLSGVPLHIINKAGCRKYILQILILSHIFYLILLLAFVSLQHLSDEFHHG